MLGAAIRNGTSLDLSRRSELRLLAALVRAVGHRRPGAPLVLIGGYARNLLLSYRHGIDAGRRVLDVDLAVAVESWQRFEALRGALIGSGRFAAIPADPPLVQKLRYRGVLEVDLVPFGGVEQPDRTIAWPPDGSFVMSALGLREAHAAALTVTLPDATPVQVASLPAQMLLKLVAWSERRDAVPGKDAQDINLILEHYTDRLGTEERTQRQAENAARLIGEDLAAFLEAEARDQLAVMLAEETDERGGLQLAGDLGAWRIGRDVRVKRQRARRLLAALEVGVLAGPREPRGGARTSCARSTGVK